MVGESARPAEKRLFSPAKGVAKIASRMHKCFIKTSSIYVRTIVMLVLKRIPYIALKISIPSSVIKGRIVRGSNLLGIS